MQVAQTKVAQVWSAQVGGEVNRAVLKIARVCVPHALSSSSATCVYEGGETCVVSACVCFLSALRHSRAQDSFFFFQRAQCV